MSNYGDRNTGSIAELRDRPIKWLDKMLDDQGAAYHHIADNHDKWDPPMAVSFDEGNGKHWLIGGWCRE